VGANAQATEQTFAVGYRMAVESVDGAGNMKVATTYDAVMFRQKGPSGAVEYDSQNPPKQVPPAARAFAALAGLGFKSTVTPAGKVTAVEGLDAMFAEMVRKPELPDGQQEEAGPVELGTGKMSYDLKGEQSGTADVDEATGWTRSLTTTQTVGGSLRFQAAGGVPEANNPISIQEKVTIEAVK